MRCARCGRVAQKPLPPAVCQSVPAAALRSVGALPRLQRPPFEALLQSLHGLEPRICNPRVVPLCFDHAAWQHHGFHEHVDPCLCFNGCSSCSSDGCAPFNRRADHAFVQQQYTDVGVLQVELSHRIGSTADAEFMTGKIANKGLWVQGGCGSSNAVTQTLRSLPIVYGVAIVWTGVSASSADIAAVCAMLPPQLSLEFVFPGTHSAA